MLTLGVCQDVCPKLGELLHEVRCILHDDVAAEHVSLPDLGEIFRHFFQYLPLEVLLRLL